MSEVSLLCYALTNTRNLKRLIFNLYKQQVEKSKCFEMAFTITENKGRD